MNLHKLNKKDGLSKIFNNIFSIVDKESKKTMVNLNFEKARIEFEELSNQREPKRVKYEMKEELASTAPGCNCFFIKDSVPEVKRVTTTMTTRNRKK